ncbi:RDD family protein [Arthrobacter antioxidans]|uniref:RDD family protein n=1 Tax=Arthrobacter antioxidans TaxID=2895818 RepID=UPI001FFF9E06|nr:RDD family protein [Arthrobacter antioxidans]
MSAQTEQPAPLTDRPAEAASTARRSLAYGIDAALVVVPAAAAVWWTAAHSFSPRPLFGWMTLGAILLVAVLVLFVYAAQNAGTGQTLGKRLAGIRVLRAEDLTTTDYSDALSRGFSYLLGVLGLGIAPIVAAVRRTARRGAGVEDWTVWPHRLDGSRVIDVRHGPDPLKPAEETFALYPEEWIADDEAATVSVSPLPAPAWSPAHRDTAEPDAVTHPAADATPRTTPDSSAERRRSETTRLRWALAARALITTTSIVGLLGALVATGHLLQPAPPRPADEREVLAGTIGNALPVTGYSGTGFPDYATTADWSIPVPASATTVATRAHIYTLDDRTLTAFDALTGTVAATLPLTSSVDVAAETQYDGAPGLFWSVGDTAYGWSPERGSEAFSAEIPAGATPYAAGAELLFVSAPDDDGNYAAWRFGPSGFAAMTVPQGFVPGALTGETLVSTNAGGEVTVTGADGSEVTSYPLQAPTGNVSFGRTVAVGHNTIAAVWSPFPDSSSPSTPVTVATYAADTGTLKSFITTTFERTDSAPSWLWGGDGTWASYAGFAFEVGSGRAVVDLAAQGVEATTVVGAGVLGQGPQGNTYATGSDAWAISGVVPLIVDESGAVVKTSRATVEKYSARQDDR